MLNDQIRDLYINKKLSIRQVGEELNMNMWAVRSRMRQHNIPRRSTSEADAITFARKPLSYNKKLKLTSKEKELHQAALMLYWAEGAKKNKWTIDFTNSDEKMVRLFIKALRIIYTVDEKKLRGQLYCYSNQNPEELASYWSEILKLPKTQFIKTYVRKDYKESKKDKLPHGVFHVRYSDKKLLLQIMREIDIIQKNLNKLRWQSGQLR